MIECLDLMCGRMGLKGNARKSQMIVFSEGGTGCDGVLQGASLEQVPSFKYL